MLSLEPVSCFDLLIRCAYISFATDSAEWILAENSFVDFLLKFLANLPQCIESSVLLPSSLGLDILGIIRGVQHKTPGLQDSGSSVALSLPPPLVSICSNPFSMPLPF